MSDNEKDRDLWVVEAIEKVIPAPAEPPALCFPDKSTTTEDPYLDSTAVTLSHASQEVAAVTTNRDVIIGRDSETDVPVRIGDKEREGRFYVLGQPRMGKSNLLISMALQDIESGHGVLFIDPHYDAINKPLARIPKRRLQDVILLHPSNNTRSFSLRERILRFTAMSSRNLQRLILPDCLP